MQVLRPYYLHVSGGVNAFFAPADFVNATFPLTLAKVFPSTSAADKTLLRGAWRVLWSLSQFASCLVAVSLVAWVGWVGMSIGLVFPGS